MTPTRKTLLRRPNGSGTVIKPLVYIDDQVHGKLKLIASRMHLSMSELAEDILRGQLALLDETYGIPPGVIPTIQVRLAGGRWYIESCPYCGMRHWHNAGSPGDDPRIFLGHSSTRCTDRRRCQAGYVLVESKPR